MPVNSQTRINENVYTALNGFFLPQDLYLQAPKHYLAQAKPTITPFSQRVLYIAVPGNCNFYYFSLPHFLTRAKTLWQTIAKKTPRSR